jgi:integrase
MADPPKLLDRIRMAVRTRHYSIRTEDAYVAWARRYILFHGKKHPSAMGAEEVNAFLTHLAVEKNVSASTQSQALSALLFLYQQVLREDVGWIDDVVRSERPKRLPVVFTREEVVRVLGAMSGTERLVAELLYGTGLRVIEGVRLRVKDLEFERGEIVVRDGKGQKDRITMLPRSLGERLAAHLEGVRQVHDRDLGVVRCLGNIRGRGARGRGNMYFRRGGSASIRGVERGAGITSTSVWCRSRFRRRFMRRGLERPEACTPCGTVSRRTSWRTATTSGRSRNCWGMRM